MIQFASLPYGLDSLEPEISKNTVHHHYLNHHQHHVNELNTLIANTIYDELTLLEIIFKTDGKAGRAKKIFNHAAEVWNHEFYWKCMGSETIQMPSAAFKQALTDNFGSYEDFLEELKLNTKELFGSGWLWLVKTPERGLKLIALNHSGPPITQGLTPVMVMDLWEHAYYLDYQENRDQYCAAFVRRIDWNFVETNFRTEPRAENNFDYARPN